MFRGAGGNHKFPLGFRRHGRRLQVSSNAFPAYKWAITMGLGDRASNGRIVKVIGPGILEAVWGQPDRDKTEATSYAYAIR